MGAGARVGKCDGQDGAALRLMNACQVSPIPEHHEGARTGGTEACVSKRMQRYRPEY